MVLISMPQNHNKDTSMNKNKSPGKDDQKQTTDWENFISETNKNVFIYTFQQFQNVIVLLDKYDLKP